MKKMKINHLPAGPNPPLEVYCLVEIPRGSTNKYEYDQEKEVFILDRVLYEAVFYPTDYGIIPATLTEDGDPLDIMVISSFPTFPGCLVTSRPIGAIKMIDSKEKDDKIIAVNATDPRLSHLHSLADLGPHFKKEIRHFWENYAQLQPEKEIQVKEWVDKDQAHQLIAHALKNFQAKHG